MESSLFFKTLASSHALHFLESILGDCVGARIVSVKSRKFFSLRVRTFSRSTIKNSFCPSNVYPSGNMIRYFMDRKVGSPERRKEARLCFRLEIARSALSHGLSSSSCLAPPAVSTCHGSRQFWGTWTTACWTPLTSRISAIVRFVGDIASRPILRPMPHQGLSRASLSENV